MLEVVGTGLEDFGATMDSRLFMIACMKHSLGEAAQLCGSGCKWCNSIPDYYKLTQKWKAFFEAVPSRGHFI